MVRALLLAVLALALVQLGCGGGGGGGGGSPVARLAPEPPSFWYVDALPLAVAVAGEGVTHYRYRLDTDGDWSSERPAAEPITLTTAPPGRRTLHLVGRGPSGAWQAAPTSQAFHLITLAHEEVACSACDFVVPATAAELGYVSPTVTDKAGWETYLPGASPAVVPPGMRICLAAGEHGPRHFRGFAGTAEAPVQIVNCGGRAVIAKTSAGTAALTLEGSRFVRLVGTGAPASPRGIVVRGAGPGTHGIQLRGGASDVEIGWVEIDGARNHAIDAKSDSTDAEKCRWNRDTFVQRNTFIHHVYAHDAYWVDPQAPGQQHGWECLYLGSSHWEKTFSVTCEGQGRTVREHELWGVRVHDSVVERCGNDGIQIGAAPRDVAVYRNRVSDVGRHRDVAHSSGIQLGSGTLGRVEANVVERGGIGIWIQGPGPTRIANNVIVGMAGAGLQTSEAPTAGPGWQFLHNTVVDVARGGCAWGSNDMCFCGDRRALCLYDQRSTGSVYLNNLAPGSDPVPAGARLEVAGNVVAGAPAEHFVDAAGGDYRLRATSTAVGAGRDVSDYGLTIDADGVIRAAPWDAGAFERSP